MEDKLQKDPACVQKKEEFIVFTTVLKLLKHLNKTNQILYTFFQLGW